MDCPSPPRNHDFCQFLVERQRMDAQTAVDVRRRSSEERMPIGQTLVLQGALSVRQVMNVLELQTETPHIRFGEIALREGYLTMTQLDRALKHQATHRRHQIAVVAQAGLLQRPVLHSLVVDYVQFLELQLTSVSP